MTGQTVAITAQKNAVSTVTFCLAPSTDLSQTDWPLKYVSASSGSCVSFSGSQNDPISIIKPTFTNSTGENIILAIQLDNSGSEQWAFLDNNDTNGGSNYRPTKNSDSNNLWKKKSDQGYVVKTDRNNAIIVGSESVPGMFINDTTTTTDGNRFSSPPTLKDNALYIEYDNTDPDNSLFFFFVVYLLQEQSKRKITGYVSSDPGFEVRY